MHQNDFINILRTKLILIPALVCFMTAASFSRASENDPADLEGRIYGSPSLNDLLSYTYEANPDVKAAKASWRVAIEKYRVETGYPDPTITNMYYPYDPSRDWANKRFETSIFTDDSISGKIGGCRKSGCNGVGDGQAGA